jgi:hypothetical protein
MTVCRLVFVASLGASLWAGPDRINVKLTPGVREYCHVIEFPQGWSIQSKDQNGQILSFDYDAEYEFRIEGILGTQFLVGGFTKLGGDRYDTRNKYKLDLSNPAVPVSAADSKAWNGGAVVPFARKSIFNPGSKLTGIEVPEFNGFPLRKSGQLWAQPYENASRLSPDSSWLVLQSTASPPKGDPYGPWPVYFDVFNADTGQRVLTFEGVYSGWAYDPDGCMGQSGWLTERYFIVPLGDRKESCLVCEFGDKRPQRKVKP